MRGELEIGQILHLESEIRNLKLDDWRRTGLCRICHFGFRIRDAGFVQFLISKFRFSNHEQAASHRREGLLRSAFD